MNSIENTLAVSYSSISAIVPHHLFKVDLDGKTYCSVKTHMQFDLTYDDNAYSQKLIRRILNDGKMSLAKAHQSICKYLMKDSKLVNDVINATQFLDVAVEDDIIDTKKIEFSVRIYCILNSITSIPLCSNEKCRMPLRNFNPKTQCAFHRLFCSIQHMGRSKLVIDRRVNGYLNRTPEQKLKTKQQTEQTILERFGDKCFMKTEYFKQKTADYIIANGGIDNVSQIQEVKEKVKSTNLEKFGYECNLAAPECIEKKTQTYLEHFGVDHCMKCPDVVQKMLGTFEKKYGSKSTSSSPRAIRHRKARMLKIKLNAIKSNQHIELVTDESSISEIVINQTNLWWKCLDCGHVFYGPMIAVSSEHIVKCPFCTMNDRGSNNHSAAEYEIVNFIRKSFPELKVYHCDSNMNRHVIYPKEIDIWIPEKNIGIEFNGIYWHSIEFQEKYDEIHNEIADKTQQCEAKGIHLIHIFQDEWTIQKDEIKALLVKFIRGDEIAIDAHDDFVILSHDKYPSFLKVDGFHLSGVIGNEVITRYSYKQLKSGKFTQSKKAYHVHSSGQLLFIRNS